LTEESASGIGTAKQPIMVTVEDADIEWCGTKAAVAAF
jgi:hypothetical protein